MSYKGNPGTNRLASVLSGRMKRESETPLFLDFGSINADYSLITNTFPVSIPKGDYTVCRSLTIGKKGEKMFEDSDIRIPEKLRSLLPGDRVLIAWVQNQPVIIDIIVSFRGQG